MGTIKYRGYTGTIENSKKDNCLFGKVINISKCSITYEGQCLNDLVKDFCIAIDDYVLECENSGVEPEELTVKPDEYKNCANCGKQMNIKQ